MSLQLQSYLDHIKGRDTKPRAVLARRLAVHADIVPRHKSCNATGNNDLRTRPLDYMSTMRSEGMIGALTSSLRCCVFGDMQ